MGKQSKSPDTIRTMGEGADALFVQSVNELRRMHRSRAARAEGAYRLDSPMRRAALALAEAHREAARALDRAMEKWEARGDVMEDGS